VKKKEQTFKRERSADLFDRVVCTTDSLYIKCCVIALKIPSSKKKPTFPPSSKEEEEKEQKER